MCYRVHELSTNAARKHAPEHILERPVPAPKAIGERGLAAVVRNLLDKIAHKKAAPARKTEVAEV
jgi:hypothetical protein